MNFEDYGDIWNYLSNVKDKSIVIYGMGNGADKILSVCESYGIEVSDFFASDGFVRGHSFHQKVVLSYSDIKAKYGSQNVIVLLSFASSLPDVLDTIYKVASECEFYAPDVPVCGENLFNVEFYNSHQAEIDKARSLLADGKSKEIFDNVINYKLSGKIDFLRLCENEKDEVYSLLGADKAEIAIDAGAYNGDTARELATYARNIKKIYALEPDSRNFRKLSQYAEVETRFDVIPLQNAAWSEYAELSYDASGNRNAGVNASAKKVKIVSAIPIDSIEASHVDYIKYDVEGSEERAILGSLRTIKEQLPSLLVSAYHRSEDIFSLILLLNRLEPRYKLYLRRYPYVPAWDLNILAIADFDNVESI